MYCEQLFWMLSAMQVEMTYAAAPTGPRMLDRLTVLFSGKF